VAFGTFHEALQRAPTADVSILGLRRPVPDLDAAEELTWLSRSSCLFVLDGGRESARA
jgi:hypothetical protein